MIEFDQQRIGGQTGRSLLVDALKAAGEHGGTARRAEQVQKALADKGIDVEDIQRIKVEPDPADGYWLRCVARGAVKKAVKKVAELDPKSDPYARLFRDRKAAVTKAVPPSPVSLSREDLQALVETAVRSTAEVLRPVGSIVTRQLGDGSTAILRGQAADDHIASTRPKVDPRSPLAMRRAAGLSE